MFYSDAILKLDHVCGANSHVVASEPVLEPSTGKVEAQ